MRERLRRRSVALLSIVGLGLMISLAPVDGSAQTVLPGTTVGDNCTKYKEIPAYPEIIDYYQCKDSSTVKFVDYYAANGEFFQYVEFRDMFGNLVESRFARAAPGNSPVIPLADSQTP